MGETLGIACNVFEKAERERDRKERMKALDEWNKDKKIRMKKASIYSKNSYRRQLSDALPVPSTGGLSSVAPSEAKSGSRSSSKKARHNGDGSNGTRNTDNATQGGEDDSGNQDNGSVTSKKSDSSPTSSSCSCVIL